MQNTRLSKLLATLTNKELKQLKKWIASPFFNQRTDVVVLFDLYLEHYKKHQLPPSKSVIFQHLFPEESYDDHKVRMVISFLNRQTEQFLIYRKRQAAFLDDKLALLAIYRERSLERAYQKLTKEVEKTLAQTPVRNADYFRLQYRFHQEQLKSEENANRLEGKNRLQHISDNLDQYMLLEKIRESIIALAYESMTNVKYDLGLYERLIDHLNNRPKLLNDPAIAVYYAATFIISGDSPKTYLDKYLELLEKNRTIFSKEELFELYTIAANYLNYQYSKGKPYALVELFNIYNRHIKLGLYDQHIAHYAFKNIVGTGLTYQAFDWVEQFIEEYTPKLEKSYQQSIPFLGFASLAWRRGQYEKALQILATTKFEDPVHNMSARMIITKIYYEQNRLGKLQKHLKAFEVFIRRLKNKYYKNMYLDMVLFAQKIFRVNPYDKKEIEKLIQALDKYPSILDKKWLLSCLKNL